MTTTELTPDTLATAVDTNLAAYGNPDPAGAPRPARGGCGTPTAG